MALEFAGPAIRLTDEQIIAKAEELRLDPATLFAVDEVESNGDGFLACGRPKILFERHIFARYTDHRFNSSHPSISNTERGGYGNGGSYQYVRLQSAIVLDRTAALKSASWGRYQVMGFNSGVMGLDVEAFVAKMTMGEAEHLDAMLAFCRHNDLLRFLAVQDWRRFTAGYNGTGNVDAYSAKLAAAYEKHADRLAASTFGRNDTLTLPGTVVPSGGGMGGAIESVQVVLARFGFDPGTLDGKFGPRTLAALNAALAAAGQRQVAFK